MAITKPMPNTKEILENFISRNKEILKRYGVKKKKIESKSDYDEGHEVFTYSEIKSKFKTKYGVSALVEIWCDVAAENAEPRFLLSIDFQRSDIPEDVVNLTNLVTVMDEREWTNKWSTELEHRPIYTIDKEYYGKLILEYSMPEVPQNMLCERNKVIESSKKLKGDINEKYKADGATIFLSCYFEEDDFEDVLKLYLTKIIPCLSSDVGTTSLQLIQARVGQGKYRSDLIDKWGGCAVTGCENLNFLVASHILPWAKANNEERLDPDNGLLLNAILDKAFDRFLMTFKNDGTPIFSKALSEEDRKCLHLDENSKIADEEKLKPCIKYLEKHRAIFEEKEAER